MFLSLITLAVALSLSVIAAYYSIAGLTAIFAAAVVPIMIMGSILELAKVVVTIWLHEYWSRARWLMKLYLVPAVLMLMLITSMGIFGFLSKAHSDQNLVSGDVTAKIAIYDEKIKIEKDNIDVNRKSLKQLDEAVDQVMGRSSDEKGADKAVAVRRSQQKERQRLLAEIAESQKHITALSEQRAPIAAEVRKVEAEVGPIKYIAALIYGDNPDANVLERAVRWVIILLVCVFDPLAIMMLLAATESLKWARDKPNEKEEVSEDGYKTSWPTRPHIPGYDDEYVKWPGGVSIPEPAYEPDDGSLTDDQLEQINKSAATDYQPIHCHKCNTELINAPGIGLFCPNRTCDVMDGPFSDDEEPVVIIRSGILAEDDDDDEDSPELKAAKAQWKAAHPRDSLKRQRRLLDVGVIDRLPWIDYLHQEPKSGFGNILPDTANKGDTFIVTWPVPNRLYKHNGDAWISIDRSQQDSYTHDAAYIDYLIQQIDQGIYDPELLSDSERDQIEQRIQAK
jgi:hypothetical protein